MIIVDEIVSVDGFASRLNGDIDFFVEREGLTEAVGAAERMGRVAAVLLGSQTYREFSEYWPTQDPVLPVNRLPKHVLSNSLESAPWGAKAPARVERGSDAATVARRLEKKYGGDVIVWGSLAVAEALLAARAVDELWLRVVPVAIGVGRTFWPPQDIELRDAEILDNGSGWGRARYQLARPF